jgi:hypothetical protein
MRVNFHEDNFLDCFRHWEIWSLGDQELEGSEGLEGTKPPKHPKAPKLPIS